MYLYRNIFSLILDMHVCIFGCMRCWCHMTSPQELRIGLLDPSRGVEAPSIQWKMKVYQVVPKKNRQKMVVMWWWWIWMGETSHSIYVLIHHQALASPSCHNHVSVTVWGLAHVLSNTLWRTGTMWPGVCSQTKPSHNKRQGDRKSMTLTYSETGKLELYPDQLNTYT